VRKTATPLLPFLMSPVIDEQPSHSLRGKGQSMRSALPFHAPLVLQLQPCFVHERRWLQGVIDPFSPKVSTRDTAQLSVYQRK
jgi:hypothetical protein